MPATYSPTAINYRLQGVVSAIDSGGSNGSLVLLAGAAVVATVQLALPCGTVSGGILTFSGTPLLSPAASATGVVTTAQIRNSVGNVMLADLSVGIPGSTAAVIIANGQNRLLITAGNAVQILAAQIIGS